MIKRIAVSMLLVVSLSGCPNATNATSPLLGRWVITIQNVDYGLELMPNGEATTFMVDNQLTPTFKWWVDGDQCILDQDTLHVGRIFSGHILNNNTSMSGVHVRWYGLGAGEAGTWTAARQ